MRITITDNQGRGVYIGDILMDALLVVCAILFGVPLFMLAVRYVVWMGTLVLAW